MFPGSLGARELGRSRGRSRARSRLRQHEQRGRHRLARAEHGRLDIGADGPGSARGRMPYRRTSAVGGPLARFWSHDTAADSSGNEQGGGSAAWPCQKPPWGELMAVDAATGEIAWRVPLGLTEQLPESRRRTGRLNVGGPIVTAAGLVFIGASDDRRFRAFDSRTGAELWVTELPLSAHAVPITYAAADGRQYVAIVAAGRLAIDDAGRRRCRVVDRVRVAIERHGVEFGGQYRRSGWSSGHVEAREQDQGEAIRHHRGDRAAAFGRGHEALARGRRSSRARSTRSTSPMPPPARRRSAASPPPRSSPRTGTSRSCKSRAAIATASRSPAT